MRHSLAVTFLLLLISVALACCSKMYVIQFDPKIHLATVVDQNGDTMFMPASFFKTPSEETGMHDIIFYANHYSNTVYDGYVFTFHFRLNNLSADCVSMEPVNNTLPENRSFPYVTVSLTLDSDQRLGTFCIDQTKENSICVSNVTNDNSEMSGSFNLHIYQVEPSSSGVITPWPDSINFNGIFRAFGQW